MDLQHPIIVDLHQELRVSAVLGDIQKSIEKKYSVKREIVFVFSRYCHYNFDHFLLFNRTNSIWYLFILALYLVEITLMVHRYLQFSETSSLLGIFYSSLYVVFIRLGFIFSRNHADGAVLSTIFWKSLLGIFARWLHSEGITLRIIIIEAPINPYIPTIFELAVLKSYLVNLWFLQIELIYRIDLIIKNYIR